METKPTKESPMAKVCEAPAPPAGEGTTEIYIDPVKEARMMRKFDVRPRSFHLSLLTIRPTNAIHACMHPVLRHRLAGTVLHDGQPGPQQYRKCANRRNAGRLGLGRESVWHGYHFAVRSNHRVQLGTESTNDGICRYATYVPFEGPVAVLLKIIGPKPLLSTCAFCWGITTLGMGSLCIP